MAISYIVALLPTMWEVAGSNPACARKASGIKLPNQLCGSLYCSISKQGEAEIHVSSDVIYSVYQQIIIIFFPFDFFSPFVGVTSWDHHRVDLAEVLCWIPFLKHQFPLIWRENYTTS